MKKVNLVFIVVVVLLISVTVDGNRKGLKRQGNKKHKRGPGIRTSIQQSVLNKNKKGSRQDGLVTDIKTSAAQIQKQIRFLKKMTCRPYKRLVNVSTLLPPDSSLHRFANYNPTVVAVKMCQPSLSFCGTEHGVQKGQCIPDKVKTEKFYVYYRNMRQVDFQEIEAESHVSCMCSGS